MRLSRRDEAWMRDQIPLPVPREEVAAIHAEFMRRREATFHYTAVVGCGIAVAMLAMQFFRDWLGLPAHGLKGLAIVLGMIVAVVYAAIILAGHFILTPRLQRMLRGILRERGHEVCVPCGYCLAGLGDDVKKCPECGAEREPMPEGKR